MPNPHDLQEDHHDHGHHGTDRAATLFVYGALGCLIVWVIIFLIVFPMPEW